MEMRPPAMGSRSSKVDSYCVVVGLLGMDFHSALWRGWDGAAIARAARARMTAV